MEKSFRRVTLATVIAEPSKDLWTTIPRSRESRDMIQIQHSRSWKRSWKHSIPAENLEEGENTHVSIRERHQTWVPYAQSA